MVKTEQGKQIAAKYAVIACGYESVNYLPKKIGILNSTFAFASEPLPTSTIWYDNCIFWTTGEPYLYGRTTSDNRIMFGGEDEPFYDPPKRDTLLPRKTKVLKTKFEKLFPDLPIQVDYSWAGTFIDTPDGLPYIGSFKQLAKTYFALGYGGNGITFSELAAKMVVDLILEKDSSDVQMFAFDR